MIEKPLLQQTKIAELESLRGLAAVLVVFYHFPKWNSILDIGIINNSYLMVELFFVLSGFVIFNAYSEKIYSSKDLMRFQFLRFGRLYPVHLVFLLIFLFIEIVKSIAAYQFEVQNFHNPSFGVNSMVAFVEQLFLVQAIGPTGNQLTFNVPAWSISVEFYTYLLFGVSVLFLKKLKTFMFGVFSLISIVMLVTQSTYGFTDLLRCFAGFFIGCLTAASIKKINVCVPGYLSSIFFMLIMVFLQLKTTKDFDVVIYFLTAALTASLLLSNDGVLKRILKSRILTWLGNKSYSIYMVHSFALWISGSVLRRILKRPEIQLPDGHWVASLTFMETLFATIIIMVFVVFLGQLTYSLIEKPMREKSRQYASNHGPRP